MTHQHLRAEADAEVGALFPERNIDPVDLLLDEVIGIIGAHRPAEDDGAGMVFKCYRKRLAENRATDIEAVALFDEQLADAAGARLLLMQDDEDRAPSRFGSCSVGIILRNLDICHPGGGLLPLLDALARGDAEQIGDTPDHMVFHLAAFAIGIDDVPEDADQLEALLGIEMALQVGGEAIIVDGGAFGLEAAAIRASSCLPSSAYCSFRSLRSRFFSLALI